ncbi:TonB family protein [Massilia haematophila]|uniref:Protein TonB n=2 Tax=Massilia TaxID=149698 RepID=A0ABV7PGM6_9BURK
MTAQAFVAQLGWVLVDFLWQGALVGCATALLLTALRNARAEARYLVACGGLLLCLLWPATALVLRLAGDDAATTSAALLLGQWLADGGAAQAGGWSGLLQGSLSWIVGAWACCAALLGLRMVFGLLWVRQAARGHGTDAHWQARVAGMARGFGIARQVGLRVVEDLASPVTAGWLRPVVLVPAALVTGMPAHLLEALLAHELAHVRRCDYLVNLVQSAIETLLFYHPAVWWISHRIRVEREHIADDLAASALGEPRRLALALSELEKLQFSHHHLAQAANGGDLMQRIKRLVRPDTEALNWKAAIPVLGLAVACIAGCAQTPAAVDEKGQQAQAADAVATKPIAQFHSCAKPHYPAEALAKRVEGTVTLRFRIEPNGSVSQSSVLKSSGDVSLDEAARVAIAKCTFTPGTVNGKPQAAWVPVQYVWKL